MKIIKRIVIAQHERGLFLKNRNIEGMLEPGIYTFFDIFNRIEVKIFDLNKPLFIDSNEDVLIKQHPALCEQYFQLIELERDEVGLVYRNKVFSDVLPPSTRQLYWKGFIDIRFERINIKNDFRLTDDKAALLSHMTDLTLARKLAAFIYVAEIKDHFVGLLIVDGKLVNTLQAGVYVYWRFNRSISVEQIDTRMQILEINGQEILSKDKVSLRINLSAAYQILDPVLARGASKDPVDYLYREIQFALRQALGLRTLDQILSDKALSEKEIFQYVAAKVSALGMTLRNAGIKDIILPGDMKEILNQVVQAEKSSQANVIKRREETAATRSLLNTAKLMEENPTLLRLKELEILEKVTEKVDRLTVFGGLDGVLNDTVKINV